MCRHALLCNGQRPMSAALATPVAAQFTSNYGSGMHRSLVRRGMVDREGKGAGRDEGVQAVPHEGPITGNTSEFSRRVGNWPESLTEIAEITRGPWLVQKGFKRPTATAFSLSAIVYSFMGIKRDFSIAQGRNSSRTTDRSQATRAPRAQRAAGQPAMQIPGL